MSLSPTEAAILAAFGASAITGAVTFSITVYSARRQRDRDEQQRQHERERDADERANRLADERRDRLRGGYQAIVYAASTMHAVAKELQAIWANEPVEVRNEGTARWSRRTDTRTCSTSATPRSPRPSIASPARPPRAEVARGMRAPCAPPRASHR